MKLHYQFIMHNYYYFAFFVQNNNNNFFVSVYCTYYIIQLLATHGTGK